jgi:hypothetical protein
MQSSEIYPWLRNQRGQFWNYRGQNKVKLFVMKPAEFRFAETYYLSPSLPFNPLSYLVRFGSKTDLNSDYQTISNMSAIRSKGPFNQF